MGNLPIHIYGYNYEHDVIVYTVVKDTQRECGQSCHHFQKCPFGPLHCNASPEFSKLKWGMQRFRKSLFSKGQKRRSSVNDRRNRSKSYAF